MLGVLLAKKNGQSIVETALILPIIVIILTGIVDFGLMFNNYLIIANASREGARSAAVGGTDISVSAAIDSLASNLSSVALRKSIYPAESMRKKGDEVIVTIEYDYKLLTPILSSAIPNPVHLKSKTVMRVE